jgi:RHS repeat-associated protein
MSVENYDWDDLEDNIVEEYDDAGNTIAENTTEPDLHGDVISQYREGQESFYHTDGQGSTLALTNSAGDVTDTYAYDAFGEVTARAGSTENPFQFIGQKGYYWDVETGGHDVRQRPLVTLVGRWLSEDPAHLLFPETNRFLYVMNRPVTHIDPSGLSGVLSWSKTLACADKDPTGAQCCVDPCKHYCWFTMYVGIGKKWSQIGLDSGTHGNCRSDLDRAPKSSVAWIYKDKFGKEHTCTITDADFDPVSGAFLGRADGPGDCIPCINVAGNRDIRFETGRPSCAAVELVSTRFDINQEVECWCDKAKPAKRSKAQISTGPQTINVADKFSQEFKIDLAELCHSPTVTIFDSQHFEKVPTVER